MEFGLISAGINLLSKVLPFLKKDVTLKVDSNMNEISKDKIVRWSLTYEIETKSDREIFVKELYVELPKKMTGNYQVNPTLTEHFGVPGKYFINYEPFKFQHFLKNRFIIEDLKILDGIVKQRGLTLVLYSPQVGTVKSNKIKLDRRWLVYSGLIKGNWFDKNLFRYKTIDSGIRIKFP